MHIVGVCICILYMHRYVCIVCICIQSKGGDLWVAEAADAGEREQGRDWNLSLRGAMNGMTGMYMCV